MTQGNTSSQDSSQDWTFKTDEELKFGIQGTQPNILMFYSAGREVGRLDFSGQKMTFSGELDASATAFMGFLKQQVDLYFDTQKAKFQLDIEHYLGQYLGQFKQ